MKIEILKTAMMKQNSASSHCRINFKKNKVKNKKSKKKKAGDKKSKNF
ncbi:hypothetical protein LNQ49_05055 [Flavobacterium sp. F-65]|uniref:Uncharacterized protein n=1 Tax=Flavobacterium pisciphilum TaxID=2893755 RepID=A0ABS8MQG4_9FLAO|nr:hypothetical protein [Flavobacterium sp. F-65]MCC9070966.1 hypothetical protein [Flavobacterium sp. F-65]